VSWLLFTPFLDCEFRYYQNIILKVLALELENNFPTVDEAIEFRCVAAW
jgi:hypothetical protein